MNVGAQTNNSDKFNIAAVILSGGAGERFGGLDKGLQHYHGKALIEHVADALTPQVKHLLICANRNESVYSELGFELISDELHFFDQSFAYHTSIHHGPMAGIVAAINALNKTSTNALLVSPCDTPHVPKDYVARLANELGSNPATVVHDGQRRQNLHCLIKREVWASLCQAYASGERAMHRWYKKVGVTEVDFSAQADCFKNINTPEQLA